MQTMDGRLQAAQMVRRVDDEDGNPSMCEDGARSKRDSVDEPNSSKSDSIRQKPRNGFLGFFKSEISFHNFS